MSIRVKVTDSAADAVRSLPSEDFRRFERFVKADLDDFVTDNAPQRLEGLAGEYWVAALNGSARPQIVVLKPGADDEVIVTSVTRAPTIPLDLVDDDDLSPETQVGASVLRHQVTI